MQMQEAILAAVCEKEASRYKSSHPKLAGAFKRMAHLHVQSIERWINMDPPRHIKNSFPHEAKHGIDPYGKVSVYSLFTASCLGLAYQYADDSIPEAPAPAEIGGYALVLQPAFHKVIASCENTYIEIDTAADLHYDATGLGRFTRTGAPFELALATPTTNTPTYLLPKELIPKEPLAIAPRWRNSKGEWTSLAALGKDDNLTSEVHVEEESPQQVIVNITWRTPSTTIWQRFSLTQGSCTVAVIIPDAEEVALTIPLLKTDGQAVASRTDGNTVTLQYRDARYQVTSSGATATIAPEVATRNGLYEILTLTRPANKIAVTLTIN
jgi:hypothetical protein